MATGPPWQDLDEDFGYDCEGPEEPLLEEGENTATTAVSETPEKKDRKKPVGAGYEIYSREKIAGILAHWFGVSRIAAHEAIDFLPGLVRISPGKFEASSAYRWLRDFGVDVLAAESRDAYRTYELIEEYRRATGRREMTKPAVHYHIRGVSRNAQEADEWLEAVRAKSVDLKKSIAEKISGQPANERNSMRIKASYAAGILGDSWSSVREALGPGHGRYVERNFLGRAIAGMPIGREEQLRMLTGLRYTKAEINNFYGKYRR